MDFVMHNGKITTLNARQPEVNALSVVDGHVAAIGSNDDILSKAPPHIRRIDLNGRRVVPGLNDSHLHFIREGLFYNIELRWDGIASLDEALGRLKDQAERTPAPQWIRVIGGWSEWQFREGRMPTLDEINEAAPDTPVFVLHLYDCAMLNRAAIQALGMDANTPNPVGGLIARDASGHPTGLLIAEPNALILYSAIAQAPKLSFEDQLNSSRHYMRELHRFGVTSVSDAGGGGQNYPDDYAVIQKLADDGQLTIRVAYSLFAQKPGTELDDFRRWVGMTKPGEGNEFLRLNGGGENLVWSAADFENFLQPRPDLRPVMESELEVVLRELVVHHWPFRIHATYDESIRRFLNIIERVNRDVPFNGLRWFLDHAETISDESMARVAALHGGIAIQHRMAYQGEYFIRRYGKPAVDDRPPIHRMLAAGIPVGAGTDGTRVASYHPWTCLWWLVSGKTVGGTVITSPANRLSRAEALRLYTEGSAWFSGEEESKGTLSPGHYADFAVLDKDYFAVPENEIRGIESVLTAVGGRVVYAAEDYVAEDPGLPPVSPDWSPVRRWGGYVNDPSTYEKYSYEAHEHALIMGPDGRLWGAGCYCGSI